MSVPVVGQNHTLVCVDSILQPSDLLLVAQGQSVLSKRKLPEGRPRALIKLGTQASQEVPPKSGCVAVCPHWQRPFNLPTGTGELDVRRKTICGIIFVASYLFKEKIPLHGS